MNNQGYEQKRRECWEEFKNAAFNGNISYSTWSALDFAFAKGYEVGKQMEIAEETVIQGWVARDADGDMFLYQNEPDRTEIVWYGYMMHSLPIDSFPDLTWSDDPIEVEITIKRKRKNL